MKERNIWYFYLAILLTKNTKVNYRGLSINVHFEGAPLNAI